MLKPVLHLLHRLPNVYLASCLGVDDGGFRDLRGVLLHADPLVELDHSYSLDLFLRVSITKYECKLEILVLGLK